MSKIVADSSAVLAYIRRESGWDAIEPYLVGVCLISAVNIAEVVGKLREKGIDAETVTALLARLALTVVPFDEAQALRASELRVATRHLGLSLGDRACLALADMQTLPVITTDHAWKDIKVGVEVTVLR